MRRLRSLWARLRRSEEETYPYPYDPTIHGKIGVAITVSTELARDVPIDVLARICGEDAARQIKSKLREIDFADEFKRPYDG